MKELELSVGFGLHVHPIEDIDEYIRKGLELHRELGFASVNLSYAQIDAMGEDYPIHMERAMQASKEMGVRFGVAHLPYVTQTVGVPQGDTFERRMLRTMDAFAMAGVDYAVAHPNSVTQPLEGYDGMAEYDNVMGHLAPFVEHANKVGLNVVIENMRVVHQDYPVHRFGAAPDELCRVADALGIGICWDTGHAHITGLKQSEALSVVGSRLKVLHLNDNFAGDDIHLAPFCGTVDWTDTMQGISALGFDGYLNFEVASGRMPADVRKSFGRHLTAIGQELMKLM